MNYYLIDGNSYVYRAYYAIRELSNSQGLPTNATYGFTNMLMKIIREKKPDGIVVSFDSPVPTERHKLYNEYKAHRPETPEDLIEQIPYIRKVISAFNVKILEIPGYEADDILGTIAKKASLSEEINVFIVTGDKDMLQIVDDRIKIYDPMKNRILDKQYVHERYGIQPERIPELMALTGDAVDNIPGIKGIGEKTARVLLSDFEDVDDLLNNADRIRKDKLRMLISENAELVRLSKKLVTLDTSVPLDDISVEEFRLQKPDWHSLLSLFSELEFGSLMKLIPTDVSKEATHKVALSLEQLKEVIKAIKGELSFDIETTNRDPFTGQLVGLALGTEEGKSFYVPISHSYLGVLHQINKQDAIELLSPIFEDEKTVKIGHDLKNDIIILKRDGISVRGPLFDTMIISYLLNPNKSNHNLEEVALEFLSHRKKTYEEVLNKRKSFAEVPIEQAIPFVCGETNLTLELKELLFNKLRVCDLERIYLKIEMPLIRVLADMEITGVKIDTKKLAEFSHELTSELDAIKKRIYFLAGEEFNLNSPKQLSNILFHNLGFKPGKRTKTGFSTQMGILEELAASHELPREILAYRSLNKLKTTYIDVLPKLINVETGRIHTSFNQTATATGRLSSSKPNLQNIPIKGLWGKRIREAFISEEDHLLLSADYSQIELRILAHMSKDDGLVEAFRNNLDIHNITASEIFGTPTEKITFNMRRIAKIVNFGIIYGISPFGLSETLNVSTDEAKIFIEKYFNKHYIVKQFIENTINKARESGYAVTLFGRKRAIPELKNKNLTIRQQGERYAINSPIQGTAADIIKIAMVNIWRRFNDSKVKAKMILQVHDELLFECPPQELKIIRDMVKEEMEGVISLSVPLLVDIHVGRNWAEAH